MNEIKEAVAIVDCDSGGYKKNLHEIEGLKSLEVLFQRHYYKKNNEDGHAYGRA